MYVKYYLYKQICYVIKGEKMILTKFTKETPQFIIVTHNQSKFIIRYYDCNLYWIMQDYTQNNEFIVTKDSPEFWEFLTKLFKENHFKNCTFLWASEQNIDGNENKLKITKGKTHFKIRFFKEKNTCLKKLQSPCSICFCLNGSRNPKIAKSFCKFLDQILNSD